MKRYMLVIAVSVLVLLSTIMWFVFTNPKPDIVENLQFVVILIIIGFGLYFGIKKWRSAKRGEPDEDELSKKIMQKASSISYFISLYLWVAMIYIKDKVKMDTEVLLGSGIIGMALILAITWLIISKIGIKNG